MNTGIFAGRVGRDADLRVTPGGDSVLNFSIAVDTGFGDNKRTLWVDCAVWGKRADSLAQYVTKGKMLTVLGDIDLRQYQKRNGEPAAAITCNVQRLTFGGGGEAAGKPAEQKPAEHKREPAREPTQAEADFDDDIPFD